MKIKWNKTSRERLKNEAIEITETSPIILETQSKAYANLETAEPNLNETKLCVAKKRQWSLEKKGDQQHPC